MRIANVGMVCRLVADRMTDTFYGRALTEECSLFISQITGKMKSKKSFLLRFIFTVVGCWFTCIPLCLFTVDRGMNSVFS